ncbi:MAG TPA: GatB/YqeY domain-containing protein [Bacteroidales bacterium]|nr:GatB/YqeY domain-containing protein [Bacteroidales bacterium]
MSLEQKINDDIKAAMLARESQKLEALRAVKAALLLEKSKEGATGEVTEEAELKILQKLVKQRRESADIYSQAGRQDLSTKEIFEASVIETYLPKQLTEAEVTEIIRGIVARTGASSIKDMGKVMGAASAELAGKADNKMISGIVKGLLSN